MMPSMAERQRWETSLLEVKHFIDTSLVKSERSGKEEVIESNREKL